MLEIKKMPLEERFERLSNQMLLVWASIYAWHKEHGTMDKWLDYLAMVQKSLLLAQASEQESIPTFKEMVTEAVYDQQKWLPFSSLEVSWVSDDEAVMKIKNCPLIEEYGELLMKAGLSITPKYICENDLKFMPKVFKEFGVDLTSTIEENGCQTTIKLK